MVKIAFLLPQPLSDYRCHGNEGHKDCFLMVWPDKNWIVPEAVLSIQSLQLPWWFMCWCGVVVQKKNRCLYFWWMNSKLLQCFDVLVRSLLWLQASKKPIRITLSSPQKMEAIIFAKDVALLTYSFLGDVAWCHSMDCLLDLGSKTCLTTCDNIW